MVCNATCSQIVCFCTQNGNDSPVPCQCTVHWQNNKSRMWPNPCKPFPHVYLPFHLHTTLRVCERANRNLISSLLGLSHLVLSISSQTNINSACLKEQRIINFIPLPSWVILLLWPKESVDLKDDAISWAHGIHFFVTVRRFFSLRSKRLGWCICSMLQFCLVLLLLLLLSLFHVLGKVKSKLCFTHLYTLV